MPKRMRKRDGAVMKFEIGEIANAINDAMNRFSRIKWHMKNNSLPKYQSVKDTTTKS